MFSPVANCPHPSSLRLGKISLHCFTKMLCMPLPLLCKSYIITILFHFNKGIPDTTNRLPVVLEWLLHLTFLVQSKANRWFSYLPSGLRNIFRNQLYTKEKTGYPSTHISMEEMLSFPKAKWRFHNNSCLQKGNMERVTVIFISFLYVCFSRELGTIRWDKWAFYQ